MRVRKAAYIYAKKKKKKKGNENPIHINRSINLSIKSANATKGPQITLTSTHRSY